MRILRFQAANLKKLRVVEKADAIGAASMPIAGLSFGDGMVLYNGLPFDQASSAEQLRISVAIAMAANPDADRKETVSFNDGPKIPAKTFKQRVERMTKK